MRLLKEPLLHFTLIGGALFAAYALIAPQRNDESKYENTIRVTAADAERLGQLWARQWRRTPSADELAGVLSDHVKEEVLAREARRMRLDENDTVVRRRLAQKLSFLLEDTARLEQPTDEQLRALYDARPDISGAPARVSFIHLFFKGEAAQERANIQLGSLSNAQSDGVEGGDSFLLGDSFDLADEPTIAGMFGAAFSRALMKLELGRWAGPVQSAYGFHLVKIREVAPPVARPFDQVRDRLAQEWQVEKQESAKRQVYAGLLRKYEIVADPEVRALLKQLVTTPEAAQ